LGCDGDAEEYLMLNASLWALIGIIAVALVFDFLNGFHDAANSIATIVSTRVLTPRQAVIWAAFFNFVAAFVFGTKVAATIADKLIDPAQMQPATGGMYIVFGGLMGAVIWNLITWWLGLPTSSSHALMSGLAGAAIAKVGFGAILWSGWVPVLLGLVLSPLIGMVLGGGMMIAMSWLLQRKSPRRVDKVFRKLQLVSAAVYSLGHGGNDAQKTMGIIWMALIASGYGQWATWGGQFHVPWVHHSIGMPIIMACTGAIALGTMFGGWRIVKTMGSKITRLRPVGGFCAETAAATTIIGFTSMGGIPISTTHAITGAILGVGTVHGIRSVRWAWGSRIVLAWVLTIPCSAFIGALFFLLARMMVPGQ
jgi:inorganic phosphate transporter, PiT family